MTLDLAEKSVLVIGLGISGCSAANFCAARGARVVAFDERPRQTLEHVASLSPGIELQTGCELPNPADFDLVVPSPGVPRERYAERARRVWGDIELVGRSLEVPFAAVTGTNGKSTCVRLIEAMLRAAGLRARAAGNVGEPALSLLGQPLDAAVLEVSSFQLESVENFHPAVAVILNLSPDHLDRHGDFESYVAAKRKLLERQDENDVAVLNFDDPVVREMAAVAKGQVLPFSRTTQLDRGVFWDGGAAQLRLAESRLRIPLHLTSLPGPHNLENVLAALAAVVALRADPEIAVGALVGFRSLPHRCEMVALHEDVRFVNDSKATNPDAARRALESFETPVLWIAGGRDKQLDFGDLARVATERVRTAFLIGEAADRIEGCLAGRIPVVRVPSLASAVVRAAHEARSGEVVLLSPACASFDQFESFAQRGECFRSAVANLRTTRNSS